MKEWIKKAFNAYHIGLLCQVLLWVFVFIMLVTAFTTGFDFSEFRYVGF